MSIVIKTDVPNFVLKIVNKLAGLWWHMPLNPVLGRQRQVDLSSRTARAFTQRNPVSKNKQKED